ncbi:hypothetical protein ACRE_034240 [Hapsidospora chrysogenum ATCC 11550]|uniref:Uncharacterized protein n=1 Tax=Hapsidospora chrysogenum (strain ATCC 11550 / CBS 779.69 / DSM 880 / IAM 14645 / JCM 23072 / IMI 49137) TaxID=857340 RepID=A0A086T8N9_HAPC1|nr:hypothetical protein ACRE_034240 [Hapsidospora chrysogenum ATCC 11550]
MEITADVTFKSINTTLGLVILTPFHISGLLLCANLTASACALEATSPQSSTEPPTLPPDPFSPPGPALLLLLLWHSSQSVPWWYRHSSLTRCILRHGSMSSSASFAWHRSRSRTSRQPQS